MAVTKEASFGSLLAIFFIVFLIAILFYDYVNTPQPRVTPLLVFFASGMFVFLFTFGDYLGIMGFKKRNFVTTCGLIGTYKNHVDHDTDMMTCYFTAYSRYAEATGFTDFSERTVIQRLKTRLSPTRMMYLTAKRDLFDFVDGKDSDAPEGAVVFHGSMRGALHGVVQKSPNAIWKSKYFDLLHNLSELGTIFERSKAISEQMSMTNNKDMVDLSIKLGSVTDNLYKNVNRINNNQEGKN